MRLERTSWKRSYESNHRIVDRGRGPQLSTCRITVQDLLPYFEKKCSYEQILEIMPVLSVEEIKVAEQYVADNREAVVAQDRRIRERNVQRTTPPHITEIARRGAEKMAALRHRFVSK